MSIKYRIGIDLGGTKIEIALLQDRQVLHRQRVATPAHSYLAILTSIEALFNQVFCQFPQLQANDADISVGIGIPGTLKADGCVKNANTQSLNGKPLQQDLQQRLQRQVMVSNDANCFAMAEASLGAAQAFSTVFAVIIGTGVGGGIIMNAKPIVGANGIAGEWGHNRLPAQVIKAKAESRSCYCGQVDCLESYLSGAGLLQTYQQCGGQADDCKVLAKAIIAKQPAALKAYAIYSQQLAASLSQVVNILDPEAIVFGGGLSHLPDILKNVRLYLDRHTFGDDVQVKLLLNRLGDSSGVFGAAMLKS